MVERVELLAITHAKHQIVCSFAADRMRFATTYWYDSVDFDQLERRYGAESLNRILFHIAAFEINKLCSLRPQVLDWGEYARFVDQSFTDLWRHVFFNVWAQWRYENDDPSYTGPTFTSSGSRSRQSPIAVPAPSGDSPSILCLFGGGKDSLVAAKLVEKIVGSYDTLAYASSIYGTAAAQHALIDRLIDFCAPRNRRRQWIYDDFLDSPVLRLAGSVVPRTLTAAETPSSIFAVLPYVLQHHYSHVCLAHERSADTGQVIWTKTGEDINHQWGKSYEAENLLNGYVSKRLIEGFQYFSILKPIYDVVIFAMLREHLDAVPSTHSCNVAKPWCKRCPKCVYVWLNYLAYLPTPLVESVFTENLFDVDDNIPVLRALLGLERQLPFECVGQRDESRLALDVSRRRGLAGKAIELLGSNISEPDYRSLIDRYTAVDLSQCLLPADLRPAIARELTAGADNARAYLEQFLA